MDTPETEKNTVSCDNSGERQLHIIRLKYSSWRWCNPDVYRAGLLTYVHQQKQTATSGNVSERFSEAASSAALETASRNDDLDTETAAATRKAQKKKQSQTTDVSGTAPVSADDYLGLLQQQSADLPKLKGS